MTTTTAEQRQLLRLTSDTDEKGIPWDWFDVVDELKEHGVLAIESLFDYYETYNTHFDSWTNYLLTCSHFSEQELGYPTSKKAKLKLQKKVNQLMRNARKNPHLTTSQLFKKINLNNNYNNDTEEKTEQTTLFT